MTDTTSCIFHTRVDMNHWIFSYYKFKQAFFIFHDEHYKLYISYQRWYESLLYPIWIITMGHFCGFCINDNTYRVKNLGPNFKGRGKTRGFMNSGQPWVWLSQLSLLHLRNIDRIAMIRLSMVEKCNKYINCSQIIVKSHSWYTVGDHSQHAVELFCCFSVQWLKPLIPIGQIGFQAPETIAKLSSSWPVQCKSSWELRLVL